MTLSQSWLPLTRRRSTIISAQLVNGRMVKRLVDLALLAATAPLTLPILGISCALVAAQSRDPFYRHRRIGRHGVVFACLKLRTMDDWEEARFRAYLDANPEAEEEYARTGKLVRDPRVSRLGRILRKTSIDELPQLMNVALGQMALVGPRPITRRELRDYGAPERQAYLSVDPGITGLWQVSGRNKLTMAQRAALDAAYVARRSLVADLQILFRTIPVVLRQTGV